MILICSKYLVLPVNDAAPKRKLKFLIDGELAYDLEVSLDDTHAAYDAYINVERFMGREIELVCDPEIQMTFRLSDEKYGGMTFYHENHRQQFHFSARQGWINDPNGLFYYRGVYHLFFQHNPAGTRWGNMHWGHATSADMLHWNESECVLYPDSLGTMFSGSAFVDVQNASGLKTDENDPVLLFYTAAGGTSELSRNQPFTQCLAFSTDGGKTFRKYSRNPVIGEIEKYNRDPKVVTDGRAGCHVCALYLENRQFALLTSDNLFDWKKIQVITLDDAECPDFYPLAAGPGGNHPKWVIGGASGRYAIGRFDGQVFVPETETRRLRYGDNSYASQTWANLPDGRCIRMAWDACELPVTDYFSKSLSFPCEMSLKTIGDDVYLMTYPIREIETLYKTVSVEPHTMIMKNDPKVMALNGTAYDLTFRLKLSGKSGFMISLFGFSIEVDAAEKQLRCLGQDVPFEIMNGVLELRMLIDTVSLELFINKGISYLAHGFVMDHQQNELTVASRNDVIWADEIKVAEIRSIWLDPGPSGS
jgi:fructan beta-fructosidase